MCSHFCSNHFNFPWSLVTTWRDVWIIFVRWHRTIFVAYSMLFWICVNWGKNRSRRPRLKAWHNIVVNSWRAHRLGVYRLDWLGNISRNSDARGSCGKNRSLSSINRSSCVNRTVGSCSDVNWGVRTCRWVIISDYGCPYWTCFYPVGT